MKIWKLLVSFICLVLVGFVHPLSYPSFVQMPITNRMILL